MAAGNRLLRLYTAEHIADPAGHRPAEKRCHRRQLGHHLEGRYALQDKPPDSQMRETAEKKIPENPVVQIFLKHAGYLALVKDFIQHLIGVQKGGKRLAAVELLVQLNITQKYGQKIAVARKNPEILENKPPELL